MKKCYAILSKRTIRGFLQKNKLFYISISSSSLSSSSSSIFSSPFSCSSSSPSSPSSSFSAPSSHSSSEEDLLMASSKSEFEESKNLINCAICTMFNYTNAGTKFINLYNENDATTHLACFCCINNVNSLTSVPTYCTGSFCKHLYCAAIAPAVVPYFETEAPPFRREHLNSNFAALIPLAYLRI
ncbi:hypothetical protein FF38_09851 [Lucilia cuprina]|uniref:Uncharacterized protein n=1 Tax=Lucilia cuprina TaxID=7375 RepID=A0A0L0CMF5_LUCCU|nr:hypothetical protein FF38_09851 [Lucilia cuprina]